VVARRKARGFTVAASSGITSGRSPTWSTRCARWCPDSYTGRDGFPRLADRDGPSIALNLANPIPACQRRLSQF